MAPVDPPVVEPPVVGEVAPKLSLKGRKKQKGKTRTAAADKQVKLKLNQKPKKPVRKAMRRRT